MAVETSRCPACGGSPHGGAPCPALLVIEADGRAPACRNCLPAPVAGWPSCAHCGLSQAPGKTVCGYCGHLWRTAEAG